MRDGLIAPELSVFDYGCGHGRDVTLRPIARTQHEHYNVYWQTG